MQVLWVVAKVATWKDWLCCRICLFLCVILSLLIFLIFIDCRIHTGPNSTRLHTTRHHTTYHEMSCRVDTRRNVSSLFQHGGQRSDGDRLYQFSNCALDIIRVRNMKKQKHTVRVRNYLTKTEFNTLNTFNVSFDMLNMARLVVHKSACPKCISQTMRRVVSCQTKWNLGNTLNRRLSFKPSYQNVNNVI